MLLALLQQQENIITIMVSPLKLIENNDLI